MSSKHLARIGALAVALTLAGTAHAASIISNTSTFTGSVITFNEFDGLLTAGPLQLGANPGDVVFTSVPYALVGANAQDLGENGLWGARGNPIDGLVTTPTGDGDFLSSQFVTRRGELGFDFGTGVANVGAYFNQFQVAGVNNVIELIAYDFYGNPLESFRYAVDTDVNGYNEGSFLGFQRAQADIYGFGIADGTFVLDDLTYSVTAVPEPAALALFLAGVAWLGVRRQRKGN